MSPKPPTQAQTAQTALPPFMQYRPDAQLVRLAEDIARDLQQMQRKAATSANLRGTEVLGITAAMLEKLLAYAVGVQSDVTNYSAALAAAGEQVEATFGLDEDTIDDLTQELNRIDAVLSSVERLSAPVDEAALNGFKKLCETGRQSINDLKLALQDLSLENYGDDDSDDDSDEEEGDEEEEEKPQKEGRKPTTAARPLLDDQRGDEIDAPLRVVG